MERIKKQRKQRKKRKLGQHERQSKRKKPTPAPNKKVRTQQEQKRKILPEENEGKLKAMVEEAERVGRECVEASNGNKSTYLSKVAQFTKSSEFERVTEAMFLPKGSMLQDQKSEFARTKIDLKFCEFVRGTENVAFFRRAAKRARGEVDDDSDDDSDDED